ncbi:MAG TPA: hypothetical protein VLF90_03485 [Patescibacteria group bacterium]|nr:hypothetical protein [Patescibacteria group bacterium]
MKLLLHKNTSADIKRFLEHPKHAMLIEGLEGVGKGAVAEYIAAEVLKDSTEKLGIYPYYLHVEPDGTSISIDTVRNIQRFMHLKTLGTQDLRRVLIIERAQTMTIEAQNAFLKLLEEPPADTLIILTAISATKLLPTLRSRVQTIHINVPAESDIREYFNELGFAKADITRAYHISQGRPGLMQAVLQKDNTHELVAQIEKAKKLLAEPVANRLGEIDELAKQKESLGELMHALELVCHAALVQASERHQTPQIKRWHKAMARLSNAQQDYAHNANPKLLLSDLMLNL